MDAKYWKNKTIILLVIYTLLVSVLCIRIIELDEKLSIANMDRHVMYMGIEDLKTSETILHHIKNDGAYYIDAENRTMYHFWIDEDFNFKGETINLTTENFNFIDDSDYSILFRFGDTWQWVDMHIGEDNLTDWYFYASD